MCEIEQNTVYLDVSEENTIFSQTKCGTETSKRSGDIYDFNSCSVSMGEGVWAGDATAWYEFNLGDYEVEEGIEIGIEFADWGWIGANGPNLYVYDWVNYEYKRLGKDLGDNDEFKWVWIKTTNSNNYISSSGIVDIKVWTEDKDWTILFHVGVRGIFIKPILKCTADLHFGSVNRGQEIESSINIENIGSSSSELDWEIESWPNWGTWTFTPSSGKNLKPDEGSVTVNVNILTPTDGGDFTGEVIIVDVNDDNSFVFIDTSLSTKINRQVSKPSLVLLLEKYQPLQTYLSSIFQFFMDV
jgi:hypothetical protein